MSNLRTILTGPHKGKPALVIKDNGKSWVLVEFRNARGYKLLRRMERSNLAEIPSKT